jgi:hypothetical protein
MLCSTKPELFIKTYQFLLFKPFSHVIFSGERLTGGDSFSHGDGSAPLFNCFLCYMIK